MLRLAEACQAATPATRETIETLHGIGLQHAQGTRRAAAPSGNPGRGRRRRQFVDSQRKGFPVAITATFSAGTLSVFGDSLDNNVAISRNAAGTILVNGGAVPVVGGTPSVANTSLMQVFGLGGNDVLALDESNGALPAANMFGGFGNDVITGGSGADKLFGQSGNDTLNGKGGTDALFGGSENDVLTGGDADDQIFGEDGDDRMIWNSGDDTDLNEGGAGNDTTEVNGGDGGEVFTATANGARVRFDRLDPSPFSIDIGTTENLVVNMNAGDDAFSATGNLAALIKTVVDGGAGNDTILGSNGDDVLLGGIGNDFIDGQVGNDVAFMGAGNDVFQWDPGDGSDVVEGQAGTDTLLFNGSGSDEIFAASANGGRAVFTRNLGNIVMDLNDVERINLNALGGTDTLTVNDLSGTDVRNVDVDLAGTIGGTAGDGAADVVIVNGTNAADAIDVAGAGTSVTVTGLAAQVSITNAEGALDDLVINALGGNDTITATALPAGVIGLTIDGGAGNDSVFGSQEADVVLGGAGNDFVFGDDGGDVAFMGAGNDRFQWDPGDDNDTIEGQDGTDELLFNGAGVAENIDISANGGRAIFFRDIAAVTMDLDDVELITFNALAGTDNVVVGDMSGTDVSRVDVNLGADGAADSLTSTGSNGIDAIAVASFKSVTTVSGIAAQLRIIGADAGLDRLTVNALGGDDTIDASALQANRLGYTANGGLGDDLFIGSAGDDFFNGQDGDDVALMGAGDDSFLWNPGDDNDTLEGQAGTDTMLFNGANAAENIDISANGGRAIFFRDVAAVTMDLNDVEAIDFNALGGADTIVINDLTGTDVSQINLDLAAAGAGDAQPDTVVGNATNGDDVVTASGDASGVSVLGLAARIDITGAEGANDRLVVNLLAGDDTFDGSGLAAGSIQLTVDGGAGDDVIIGGAGNDLLLGGAGDDVLIGGPGTDVIDGGAGDDDIEIQLIGGDVTVRNFEVGHDQLDLSAFGAKLDVRKLIASSAAAGDDTTLVIGGREITLLDIAPGTLHLDDILMF
jgi:Ca2+-binding RTX toxin-like protein